jgi:hypothetical protein
LLTNTWFPHRRQHDGKFTLEDLLAFSLLCRQRAHYQSFPSFEASAHLQGYCSLRLWQALCAPDGHESFANWICTMLVENSPERRRFWRYGAHQYLHVDTLEALHALLRAQETVGAERQAFYDLLQRVGEERRLMDVDDEELDDWVPLGVLKEFALGLARGAARLMGDIVGALGPDDLPPDSAEAGPPLCPS